MESPTGISRKEIHLRDYFMVLDRYKWLILAAVLITLSATALCLSRQMPTYQAQAKIIIEPKQVTERYSAQSAPFSMDRLDLETQVATIKTTPVLASVVKQLGLTTASEGSPEFSGEVSSLRRSIEVKLIKNTRIATITTTRQIPESARDVANAIAQAYIDQDRLSRLQAGRDAIRWLNIQLADLRIKLKDSEEVFQKFKEREGMITLDDKRSTESGEIAKLNTAYTAARANRLEVEAIISEFDPSNDADANIPISLLNSPTLQKLGMELGQLQAELVDKRKLFKNTYPGVIELKDRIQSTAAKISLNLKRQRDFLQAQEQSFLAQQEAKRSEILKLGRKELEYLTREREVTTNREMYNTLLPKVKELSLAGESGLNSIRIVEQAELPTVPMSGKMVTLILGGILGLFLGIGLAFFLKYLDNTIRVPDDVEQHLNLPVLGIVPQSPKTKEGLSPPLMLNGNLKSAQAEAYRSLRTNILFSVAEAPPKTIVITSAGEKEGKSTTVVNLGTALAQAGQKVLLVDADLRRPRLHRMFRVGRSKGLSQVLMEGLPLDEAIVEADMPNLSVLTAGPALANPSEALGSTQMKDLIAHVRDQYDIVLIDSAPVLGMTDAVVLASESDAVALVIKTGEATRGALKIALAQLGQVRSQVCGVILNYVDIKRDRYYRYYRYFPYEGDKEEALRPPREGEYTQVDGRPSLEGT